MSSADLSTDDLAHRCLEETEKFNRRQESDDQFCFELWRRAFVDVKSDAFTHLFQIYTRSVTNWVYSHSRFEQTGEDADFFAQAALRKFYFALRGEKFKKFAGLPQILSYLKRCVHTEIMQYLRDQRPIEHKPLDVASGVVVTPDLDTSTNLQEIWACVEQLLPDERDRFLARLVFAQDLKPRQIIMAYSGIWQHEREVTLTIYRIRRLLRNDSRLRRLFGLDEKSDQ
ncbi:MAG: hypothetical protein MI924_34965 [Chloroflexales bacterium]|nr:hypothetical protein [Chloroflexales bacterium]